jgi:glycosyltransferase involved in cell wall biosynthesis
MRDAQARPVVLVLSQEPPPIHGSTVMTVTLRGALRTIGVSPVLIDRRFSRNVADVGQLNALKLFRVVGLVVRVLVATLIHRSSPLVFFCTNRPGSFLVDCLIGEVLRLRRTRVILYIHTRGYTDLANRNKLWRFLVRRLLSVASEIVILGPALEDDIRAWVQESVKLTLIPNTVVGDGARQEEPAEGRTTILFMSNLIEGKGGLAFVELAIELAPLFPEFDFRMAGAQGDTRHVSEIRRLIESSAMAGRIEMLGPVGKEKWELFRRTHLLVFPSTYAYEAQPLTILEAMSSGVPTVAFDVGGVGDLISDGVNGLLAKSGDVPALTRKVEMLLADSEAAASLREGATTVFESTFSTAVYTGAWRRVLERHSTLEPGLE